MEQEKNVESDLGIKSEISFVVANLIQCEEHISMTIAESQNKNYLPILEEVRKLRAKYMKEYIGKELSYQDWCTLKHILGTAYRLTEIGTKNISLGNNDKSLENFKDAKEMFELSFLLINMGNKNGING